VTDYFTGDDRSNRERMLAGEWYVSDDPESWDQFKRAVRLQTRYTAAYAEDPDAARPILEELLGHLGEQAHVRPPLFVDYGSYISVGARTFINYNLTALDVAPIVIGEDCQIGPNVQLLTPVHPLEAQPRKDRLEAARPITIGNNVWLGGGAIICPGVSIGDDSVIGAGAVVTRDIPPRSLAVGSPARVIREL
jgi:maltose O-acetyltransferase